MNTPFNGQFESGSQTGSGSYYNNSQAYPHATSNYGDNQAEDRFSPQAGPGVNFNPAFQPYPQYNQVPNQDNSAYFQPEHGHQLPPFPASTQPKGNKLKLMLIGAAIIVLLLVIAGGAYFFLHGSESSDSNGVAVVKTYLNALKDANADLALAQGASQPSNKDWLTSDTLKKQIQKAPITDINVNQKVGSSEEISYSFNIGGKSLQGNFTLVKDANGSLKLSNAFVSLGTKTLVDGLSFFGQPITDSTKIYVFPGALDFGAVNGLETFTVEDDFEMRNYNFDKISFESSLNLDLRLTPHLTPEGTETANKLIHDRLISCSKSGENNPDECPSSLYIRSERMKDLRISAPKYKPTAYGDTIGEIHFSVDVEYKEDFLDITETRHTSSGGKVNLLTSPGTVNFSY